MADIDQDLVNSENALSGSPDVRKYVFRGDDGYKGGAVGRAFGAEADAAQIQNFGDHVLRKESNVTSRFTSFTTEMKIARKFTKWADDRRVARAELTRLRELECQGIIRVWSADQVFAATKDHPGKLGKQASDVRASMRRNSEILIEGQIPPGVVIPVNP